MFLNSGRGQHIVYKLSSPGDFNVCSSSRMQNETIFQRRDRSFSSDAEGEVYGIKCSLFCWFFNICSENDSGCNNSVGDYELLRNDLLNQKSELRFCPTWKLLYWGLTLCVCNVKQLI